MGIFSKRTPNIRTLQCFVAVARELNFRRAAELLNMSQPPLSRQIQGLEELLQVRLIQRNTHTVRLTEAGEVFEKKAHAILVSLDAAVESLHKLDGQSREEGPDVRLGLTSVIDFSQVPQVNAVLSHADFAAKQRQERAYSKNLVERVRSGRLDLAIVGDITPPNSELTVHRVGYEPMMMALPASHPAAAQKARIALADLGLATLFMVSRGDNPVFHDKYERLFDAHGYTPPRRLKPPDFMSLLARIAAGEGIAFCPASMRATSRLGVVYRPLEPELERDLMIDVQLVARADENRFEVLKRVDAILSAR